MSTRIRLTAGTEEGGALAGYPVAPAGGAWAAGG